MKDRTDLYFVYIKKEVLGGMKRNLVNAYPINPTIRAVIAPIFCNPDKRHFVNNF